MGNVTGLEKVLLVTVGRELVALLEHTREYCHCAVHMSIRDQLDISSFISLGNTVMMYRDLVYFSVA